MTQLDIDTKARLDARFGTAKEWVVLWNVRTVIGCGPDTKWGTLSKHSTRFTRAEAVQMVRDWRIGKWNPCILPRVAENARIVHAPN